jgi:hypothetical protein
VLGGVWQGDQIGRIFAHWVIVYFGCSKTIQAANISRLLSPQLRLWINFEKKCFFSKTHLVTLVSGDMHMSTSNEQ